MGRRQRREREEAEPTSDIPRLERLLGADVKERPRFIERKTEPPIYNTQPTQATNGAVSDEAPIRGEEAPDGSTWLPHVTRNLADNGSVALVLRGFILRS